MNIDFAEIIIIAMAALLIILVIMFTRLQLSSKIDEQTEKIMEEIKRIKE